MIPLPKTFIHHLKHSEVAPIGVTKQWQAHEDGSRSAKYRMIHDQSFEASFGESVNRRVNIEALESLFYGHCLTRMLHQIVALRIKFPSTRLLAAKTDFKAAYRRITMHGKTAARCTITHKEFALPGLRLTFGGRPCAYEFCVASEMCTDLANDILHAKEWNPRELHSPHANKIPEPILLDDSIPYAPAEELDVNLDGDENGRIDDFIDDGMVVIPDIGDNRARASGALLLAIHILCRPLSTDEPIDRDDPLSLSKLSEDGTLSEIFTMLGWRVNLRSLRISLPRDKYIAWSNDLNEVIQSKKVSFEDLDTMIGRLNHASQALPLARYFLNRTRNAALRNHNTIPSARRITNKTTCWLSKAVLADLKLFSEIFLPRLYEGISINLLTFRRPTHIFWSGACPSGMGGYSQHSGKAWHFAIPIEFTPCVQNSNNLLEFVASVISVWVEILDNPPIYSCFFSFADNTSAVGWLHKANVDDSVNKPLQAATRHFANILLQANCCLYSQHFKGCENKVADTLSRKFDLSDTDLENFIISNFSSQVPSSFRIVPLPQQISSWVTWLLHKISETTESPNTRKRKRHVSGNVGWNTVTSSKSMTTFTYKTSPLQCEPPYSVPSQQHSEGDSFLDLTKLSWERAQSKRPWQSWARSLGQTWGTTPTMAQGTTQSLQLYLDNLKE
jgi:hypothetical protein